MLPIFIFICIISLWNPGTVNAFVDDSTNSKCADNPTICMMSLLKLWEDVRVNETKASTVLLPTLYYSSGSLVSLCELYSEVYDRCGLENCSKSDVFVGFVTRHFGYICEKESLTVFLENHECITSSIAESNCTSFITEKPEVGGELYCPKVSQYLRCQENLFKSSCGVETANILKRITEKYGCDSEDSAQQSDASIISVDEATTITTTIELPTTTTTNLPDVSTVVTPPLDPSTIISLMSNNSIENATVSNENITAESIPSEFETIQINDAAEMNSRSLEEIDGSGEVTDFIPTTITTTNPPSVRTRKPKRFRASNMTDCYTSILSDFGRYLHSSPSSSFVRFPLFGLKTMEIEVLCSKYEISEECVEHFCVGNCRLPPVKSFVDAQLKEACKMKNSESFEIEFTCLQNTLADSPECTTFINTTSPNRCDGHGQFKSCILEKIRGECSEESVNILTKLQNGFGCRFGNTDEDRETENELEGSAEGSGSRQEPETIQENIRDKTAIIATDDKLLTPENKTEPPLQCSGTVKTNALSCLAPLLRLWTGIKENRKETEVVFPIFQFSKIELLELCDSFANYRNCIRLTDSTVCKDEPMMKFVEQHFGQVCTTQTIEAAIRTHNCINFIDSRSLDFCGKFAKGETLPGKRKCSRVRHYTKCLRKLVSESCGHLMLAQYDLIVDRFGC